MESNREEVEARRSQVQLQPPSRPPGTSWRLRCGSQIHTTDVLPASYHYLHRRAEPHSDRPAVHRPLIGPGRCSTPWTNSGARFTNLTPLAGTATFSVLLLCYRLPIVNSKWCDLDAHRLAYDRARPAGSIRRWRDFLSCRSETRRPTLSVWAASPLQLWNLPQILHPQRLPIHNRIFCKVWAGSTILWNCFFCKAVRTLCTLLPPPLPPKP